MKFKACPECGVPEAVSKKYTWNTDGTITEKEDPQVRMAIFETDNLRGLFSNIEESTRHPIDEIITEEKRKHTLAYLRDEIGDLRMKAAQLLGMHPVFHKMEDRWRILGYGSIEILKIKRKRSAEVEVSWPYSLQLSLGDFTAAAQVALRSDVRTDREMLGENQYLFKATAAPFERAPREHPVSTVPSRLPGDIEHRPCPGCGIPLQVGRYQWNLEKGIITDPLIARRMAIYETAEIGGLLRALEEALGETVINIFVKSQREYIKSAFSRDEVHMSREGYRRLLALRGLGFLRDFKFDTNGMYVRIDNPALPTLLAGTMAAFYEVSTGDHGEASWRVENGNSLVVEIERTSGTII